MNPLFFLGMHVFKISCLVQNRKSTDIRTVRTSLRHTGSGHACGDGGVRDWLLSRALLIFSRCTNLEYHFGHFMKSWIIEGLYVRLFGAYVAREAGLFPATCLCITDVRFQNTFSGPKLTDRDHTRSGTYFSVWYTCAEHAGVCLAFSS